jgi:hypothetical protein
LAEQNSKGKVDFFIAPETAFPGEEALAKTDLTKVFL